MTDIARAYEEAKSLPDEALAGELQNPSGMMPGYIAMSELSDRKALRNGGASQAVPKSTMVQELLAGVRPQQPQGYASGGIIARLNPMQAFLEAMQNPELSGAAQQEAVNSMYANQPPLMPLQGTQPGSAPVHNSQLVPQAPGSPEQVRGFYGGGIASLYRR